jgi:hypothetical protein
MLFDQRASNHPRSCFKTPEIIGIIGGDVLQIASHGIETKAPGGIDIAQTDPALASENSTQTRNGQHPTCAVFTLDSPGRTLCRPRIRVSHDQRR